MEINIHQLAKLAKIDISSEEEAAFTESVSGVMHWIDKLQEVDTSGITLTELESVSAEAGQ